MAGHVDIFDIFSAKLAFCILAQKPSQARIEDLQQPWEEGTALGTSMLPARADGEDADAWHQPFYTMIQAGGLLEKNKEYFKSVHLTGEGLAKEMAEAKR